MKFFKYISVLAISAVALTSCSSDDSEDKSFNTAAGVGVSVESAEMIVNEAKGIFQVPLVVTGDANGYIRVTVKITGTDDPNQEQAIADSHFYLTSNTVFIPKDSKVGYVELRTQYLTQRDEDKYFKVVIESAEGATVEPLNATTICIQDRMKSPLYQLQGPWTLAYDINKAPTTASGVQFEVVNELTGECVFKKFAPAAYSGMDLPLAYRENPTTSEWELSIVLGGTLATLNFGADLGECDVRIGTSSGRLTGEIKGTWNKDHTSVSFADGFTLWLYKDGMSTGYYWKAFTNCVFTPNIE